MLKKQAASKDKGQNGQHSILLIINCNHLILKWYLLATSMIYFMRLPLKWAKHYKYLSVGVANSKHGYASVLSVQRWHKVWFDSRSYLASHVHQSHFTKSHSPKNVSHFHRPLWASLGGMQTQQIDKPNSYTRRRPERTPCYQLVQSTLNTFIQNREIEGKPLPENITQEFDAYLKRGIPAYGFIRLICGTCKTEQITAFSCKKRGFCPSCCA